MAAIGDGEIWDAAITVNPDRACRDTLHGAYDRCVVYAPNATAGLLRRECQAHSFSSKVCTTRLEVNGSFKRSTVVGVHAFAQRGPKTGTARTVETIGGSVAMPYRIATDQSAAQRAAMRSIDA